MVGRIATIVGGILAGVIATTVIYEIIDRKNPELVQKVKGWFRAEDDFEESEEAAAE